EELVALYVDTCLLLEVASRNRTVVVTEGRLKIRVQLVTTSEDDVIRTSLKNQFLDQQLEVSLLCASCARERYFLTLCLRIFQQTARLGTTTDRRSFVASTEVHSCLDVTHELFLFDVFLYEPPATV